MNFLIVVLICFTSFLHEGFALDAEDYAAYIEELSHDDHFLDEYAKWSQELFAQPDYVYGKGHENFPCERSHDKNHPTSVHALKPSEIKCIGAMGDSLTAGLGAHALTPFGLVLENRGVSWSIGGDYTYSKILSMPNALKQYNSTVGGYSTKVSVIFLDGQDAKNNRLNVAKSGARSKDMPQQAQLLLQRMKNEKICDWKNDWKLITLFVGGNDLCTFCEDNNTIEYKAEQYRENIRKTLDILYYGNLSRTFVNLVSVLDVRGVKDLNSGGFVCQILHKKTCPCAAFPTPDQATQLDKLVDQYKKIPFELIDGGRYDGRDDFTVVVQPFLSQTKLPRKTNGDIDFSYFAPDCFHFSGKGHSQAALSLWNNMFEPVGAKQSSWHMGESLKCPTNTYPYLFTKKNSAQALEEYTRSTTKHSNPVESSTATSRISTTHHHKHHKKDKMFSHMQVVAFIGLCFILFLLLIFGATKTQRIRVYIHGKSRRHINGFQNPKEVDDDEDTLWDRVKFKSDTHISDGIPKTHGTRINFE